MKAWGGTKTKGPISARSERRLEVRLVSDLGEVQKLRPLWDAWNSHPNSDFELFHIVLRERKEIITPYLLIAYNEHVPIAMLAGRLELSTVAIKFGYFNVFSPKVRVVTLPYGGFLGDQADDVSKVFVSELMSALRRRVADAVCFEPLDTGSAFYLYAKLLPKGLQRDRSQTERHHWAMTLYSNSCELYDAMSPKGRKNLKWQAKRLRKAFRDNIRIRDSVSVESLEDVVRDIEGIARKTYQRGIGVGFSSSPETVARLKMECQRGRLRVYVLYIENSPAAFWLGTISKDTLHSDFMGYDPDFAKYSPGMYLITEVIAALCDASDQRVTRIDFGQGDAQYKALFGTFCTTEAAVRILAPTCRGMFISVIQTVVGQAEHAARRLLGQVDALGRIKTWWRQFARRQLAQSGFPE
jgi:hypothetical protein